MQIFNERYLCTYIEGFVKNSRFLFLLRILIFRKKISLSILRKLILGDGLRKSRD
jgi:hypothetical protein